MIRTHLSLLILLATLVGLLPGYGWGLPDSAREQLLFDSKEDQKSKIETIREAYARYRSGENLSNQDQLHIAARGFLLAPYAPDDVFVLSAISRFRPSKFNFDPGYYIYGGGLIYPCALALKLAHVAGLVNLVPDEGYYLLHPEELGKLYRVLRLTVVLMAALGLWIAFLVAKRHLGTGTALLGWALLMMHPVIQANIKNIDPHLFFLAFFMISIHFCLQALRRNRLPDHVLAGLFAGFSVGTQATSILIAICYFVCLILLIRQRRERLPIGFALYSVAAPVGVFLLNPYYLLNPEGFLGEISQMQGKLAMGFSFHTLTVEIPATLLLLYVACLAYHCLRAPKNPLLLMVLAMLPFGAAMYIRYNNETPYMTGLIVLLTLVSANAMVQFVGGIKTPWAKFACVAVVVLLLLPPSFRTTSYLTNYLNENDHRTQAGRWINENVPQGADVGVNFPPTIWGYPPFKLYRFKYIAMDSIGKQGDPDFVITSRRLPQSFQEDYKLVKEFPPVSLFGIRLTLPPTYATTVAQTYRIYKRSGTMGEKPNSQRPKALTGFLETG